MLKVIKILSIVFLLAFSGSIWFGCSNEPNVADPPDPAEMTVTVWPEDGATNVARDVKPTFTFSHELNNEIPNITVSIQGSGQEIALTVVKVSSTVYRIEFTNLLDELTTYDMYLHNAKGKNGEILSGSLPILSSFTTQEVIIPPLTITVIFPPNNSEIPDMTSTLHYRADYDLDPATVEPSFTLTNTTTSTQLNPTVDVNGKDIYVNVDGLLEHSSAYTAKFDPDIIRGTNGEKPNTTYSFMFTTEAVYVQQPFTTPEGFLQMAGDFYDGKYYVGGYGPNDEGFVACFNWEGDSLWFNEFTIDGPYARVSHLAVNSTGIYSVVLVNPSDPISREVWLYRQSLDGEYLDKWKLSDAGIAISITSSEADIYIVWAHNHIIQNYLSRYSSSGLLTELIFPSINSVFYSNSYLYISGTSAANTELFVSKWYSNLSDSLWYRKVQHIGVFTRSYLTNVADQIWCLGWEYDQQSNSKRILLRYDTNGLLLADLVLPYIDGNFRGVCSDDVFGYMAGSYGLFRVDLNANILQLIPVNAQDVFRADDPSGSSHKIAVTDRTNVLKLYNR